MALDANTQLCGSCKHWDSATDSVADTYRTAIGKTIGLEDAWDHENNDTLKPVMELWGECTKILQKENVEEGAIAMLSDGSGYWASLATKAEFGCALWEAKPLPTADDVRGILADD